MINEREENYKYLINKAINDENLDLLKSMPEEYLPNISTKNDVLEKYCADDNLFIIKYIKLTIQDKNILSILLKYACQYGKINIVKYLIEKEVDFHIYIDYALIWACQNGHLNVVNYLKDYMDKYFA